MGQRRSRFAYRVLILVWSLTSCAGPPPLPEGLGGAAVLEAWRDETSLSLKYMGPEGLVYSLADWSDELARGTALPETVSLVVVNPDQTGREPWGGRTGAARSIPVVHASEYMRFRNTLLAEIVPRGGREAVTVTLGRQEIALYFDEEDRFQSVMGELPEGVRVRARYSLEEYLAKAPDLLESQLAELGISAREVVFNTGDTGEDALPFLYANLDSKVGAFVRAHPIGGTGQERHTLVPMTEGITHLLRSHTTGLVNRPVTSLARLMFAITDAAWDSLDTDLLELFESSSVPALGNSRGMDLPAWERALDRLLGRPADRGTLEVLIDGSAFFGRLEETLLGATESIHMRTYIFDNDDYAMRVANLLRSRADEAGVDVRVLVDGIGTLAAHAQPPVEQSEGYEAPVSIERYLEAGSRVEVRRLANPFLTGDHTKVTLIDSERAFLGGMNIGREYRYEWHDLMVEITGPVVATLADDFDVAWATAGPLGDLAGLFARIRRGRDRGPEVGYPIRVLYTRPTASEIRRVQLEALRRSERYVYVQNAYLTDDAFLAALIDARRRGVDVRVVIPLQSDRGQLARDNILAANALFDNGVRVYIYPGMSHVKAAIFDGWACFGSANLDQLSLRINLETNLATSEPAAVEALERDLFEADFEISPEMREVFPERWVDHLWELVGDWVF
jgi:cardiolipin synthase